MAEENVTTENEQTLSPEELLIQMSETMVPKAEAEQWRDKYNKLFKSVADGTFKKGDAGPTKEDLMKDADQKLRNLYDGKITGAYNRGKALQDIDDAFDANGRRSIFGTGETEEQIANLKKFREYHRDVLSRCGGDDKMYAMLMAQNLA